MANGSGSITSGPATLTLTSAVPLAITCASNRTVECGTAWDFNAPAVTGGCSGTNAAEGIAQLGLTERLKNKTVFTTAGPVTDYLARGDFEIGIQQTNIMVGVPGTDYVGPLPGFLNKPCQSTVALSTNSKQPEAARAMIRFMISPEAAPLLRKTYVEPFHP